MKTITPFLLRFALFASLLTIAFRFFISYGIDNKSTILVGIVAVVYFLSLFFGGWYFGKKDGNYLPIYDVGFRFHLTIYLIYNVISEGWFFFDLNSSFENIRSIHLTALLWGGFLMIHFIVYLFKRKNSINDLSKEDLFD